MFIRITQDGSGRILNDITDEKFVGLYTDSIETCIIFAVKGEKGIVLVHKSSQTNNENIVDEFKSVGKIEKMCIAYSPFFYHEGSTNKTLHNEIDKVLCLFDEDTYQDFKDAIIFEQISYGFFAVDRGFCIKTESSIPEFYEPAKIFRNDSSGNPVNLRNILCKVNNMFLTVNESLKLDVQFNGTDFSDPFLNKNDEQVIQLLSEKKFRDPNHRDMVCLVFKMYCGVKILLASPVINTSQINLLASSEEKDAIEDKSINSRSRFFAQPLVNRASRSDSSPGLSPELVAVEAPASIKPKQ